MTSKNNNHHNHNTQTTPGESEREPQLSGLRRPSSPSRGSRESTQAEPKRRALWRYDTTQAELEEVIRQQRAGASAAGARAAAGLTRESDAGAAGSGRRGGVDERQTAPDVARQAKAKRGGGR